MDKLTKSPRLNYLLGQMGIFTPYDVINHLPRRYEDFSYSLEKDIKDKQRLVLLGKVISIPKNVRARGIDILTFDFISTSRRYYKVVFFNQPYLAKTLKIDETYSLVGTFNLKRNEVDGQRIIKGEIPHEERLKPIYSLPSDYQNHLFASLAKKSLETVKGKVATIIPYDYLNKYRLVNKEIALNWAHNPKSQEEIRQALRHLKYEEALTFSLKNQLIRESNKSLSKIKKEPIDLDICQPFLDTIPYKLTEDQVVASKEIIEDMNQSALMYRLLQGDVLHVAGEELAVGDPVRGRIGLRILDGLRNIFDTNDFRSLAGDELGDGAGAGVQVIDYLVAGQGGELARDTVQAVGLLRIRLVERFRADLETQAFHLLVDGLVALVQDRGLVADGIVQFLVDDVPEGGDLREFGRDGFQEGGPALFILVGEAHDQHDRTRFRRPDEHVAEETVILADIVEFVAVINAELLDEQADRVGRFGLEPAFANVQDLVEELSDMEPQSHPLVLRNGVRILAMEQPAAAGCAEFQFVTIILRTRGGEGWTDLRHFQMADPDQLVIHLLPLRFELHFVGQGLPAAAAAHAEMLAERLEPVRGRLHHPGDEALHVVLLFLVDLNVHDVAGHGEIDKHHHPVHMGEGFALGRDGFDGDVLQFQVDSLSAHIFIFCNIQSYAKMLIFA